MPESIERRLAKLEERLALQEQRMQALLSRKGGYIDGRLRLSGDVHAKENEAGQQEREDLWQAWTEHFDGDSRPAGWALAGAPFAAPVAENYSGLASLLTIGPPAAVGGRSFLYTTTFTLSAMVALVRGMSALTTGCFFGLRADDGGDDNYVEGGYYLLDATARPNVWEYRLRYRTGGGTVTALSGASFSTSFDRDIIRLDLGGTVWSNWYAQVITGQNPTLTLWNTGSVSGLSWTPARKGIVVENVLTNNWYRLYVDAVRI